MRQGKLTLLLGALSPTSFTPLYEQGSPGRRVMPNEPLCGIEPHLQRYKGRGFAKE